MEEANVFCEKYASQGEWESDEIKQYLSEGYTYRQIAYQLHVNWIFTKYIPKTTKNI